jgi:hypothetical protein
MILSLPRLRLPAQRPAPIERAVVAALALLVAGTGLLAGQDYYVDPTNGSDAQAGTSAATAFLSLAKAVATAGAPDTILLASGGTCRAGSLTVNGAAVAAYGSGVPPVITATTVVTGWSPWASNPAVLTAQVTGPVLALYARGVLQILARFPNIDASDPYLHNSNSTDAAILADAALSGDGGQWAGAQVRWRRWSWWWETRAITADNGLGTLSLDPSSEQVSSGAGALVSADSCFYIDNSLSALDEPGEWFFDAGSSTLYFWPPAGIDPAAGDVEIATSTAGITAGTGASFTGIAFRGFAGTALSLAQQATVSGCSFRQIEDTGLAIGYSAGGSQVTGCTFVDIRNSAIGINQNASSTGTVVSGNTMASIGMIPGYGGSGSYHSNGVVVTVGSGLLITGNRMSDIGAVGVLLGTSCSGNHVHDNVLVRCMAQLNDGSAIYGDCGQCDIQGNIIVSAIGNLSTSQPWTPLGHGIWLDTVSPPAGTSGWSGHTISGNVVVGSGGNGLWMPHQFNSTISGNILLGNQLDALHIDNAGDATNLAQGQTITGNTLAAVGESRYPVQSNPNLISWAVTGPSVPLGFDDTVNGSAVDYGTMSGTVLIWPAGAVLAEAVAYTTASGGGPTTNLMSVAAWQGGRPWSDPAPTTWNRDAVVVVNDTGAAAAVALPAGSWIGTDGTALGLSVTLAAYTGKVLLAAAGVSAAAVPLITSASGIDYRVADPFTVGVGTVSFAGAPAGAGNGGSASSPSSGSSSGHCGLGLGASALLLAAASLVRRRRLDGQAG